MNKPASAATFLRNDPTYDEDGYGWAMHQAALIRARQTSDLDWDNIAEEIESMGRREYYATESALRIVLLHMLKWEHQPSLRSRSWANSIREHLRRFDLMIANNPGLKPHLDEMMDEAYRKAKYEASEETGFLPDAFPEAAPGWDKIRGSFDV